MREQDNGKVICPECCHEFYAICIDDQKYRASLESIASRVANLDLGSKGYCSMDLSVLRRNANAALNRGVKP